MKRIGIVGAGRFGQALINSLSEKGAETLLIDHSPELVQEFADLVSRAIQGDASNLRTLKEAGFAECDVAVICIGDNMEGSIMATVNCKDLGIPTVIAKAVSELHGKVLNRVGADVVIYPNRDRAQRLAHSLMSRSPIDLLEVIDGVSLAEVLPPAGLIGKTLAEASVRQQYGVTVLALRRQADDPRLPRQTLTAIDQEKIEKNDRLLIFGPDARLDEFSHA